MGLQTLSPPPGPERALRANKWASASASPSGERARAGPPGQTGISVLVQGLLPGADPVSSPPRHPLCAVCTDPEHGTSEPSERLPPGCAEAAWPPGDRSSAPLVPAGGSNSGPRPTDPAGLPVRDRKRHTLLCGLSQTRRPGKGPGLPLVPSPGPQGGPDRSLSADLVGNPCASPADWGLAEQRPLPSQGGAGLCLQCPGLLPLSTRSYLPRPSVHGGPAPYVQRAIKSCN